MAEVTKTATELMFEAPATMHEYYRLLRHSFEKEKDRPMPSDTALAILAVGCSIDLGVAMLIKKLEELDAR